MIPTKIFIQKVFTPYGRPIGSTIPIKAPSAPTSTNTIRNRLIDLLRKETSEMEKEDSIVETEKQRISDATTELKNITTEMPGSKLEEREM